MRLPSKNMVIAACCGSTDLAHPILPAIARLSGLHRTRLTADPVDLRGIDCARATLVREIDRWVVLQQFQRPAAYLHTESLGCVVDRMARTHAWAWQLLLSAAPADLAVHAAWTTLAELTDGYHDLVTEVESGRRRFPSAQPWELAAADTTRSRCW
ncbi:DUF4254 domain-containing protein [Nocardia aurantia]|uniref:DUF4254 domain-containing protein n=1 Tax=Nocardia aurantia TaxID=2585199 RepID=A0A7K0DXI8_9NOCA|nr:DUF4254 domain-containing protein [Nocardia aurantia]MQY30257.1 hypothetical protein [Nocardia aurantia]